MKKGTIFVDYWIQCGRCEHMEALAASTRKAANEEWHRRGWNRRHTDGYICPECVQRAMGSSFITTNATRLDKAVQP